MDLRWQWYYWIFSILAGVGLVMVIFLCPETKFSRPAFAVDGELMHVDEYGNMVTLEKDGVITGEQESDEQRPFTWAESLLPFQRSTYDKNSFKTVLQCYVGMAYSLLDPAIIFSLGASSLALGVNIAISLSFGRILQDLYGWPGKNTGLVYAGALPACALAFICAGWGGDKINLALARRNKGLHLPEHRVSAVS